MFLNAEYQNSQNYRVLSFERISKGNLNMQMCKERGNVQLVFNAAGRKKFTSNNKSIWLEAGEILFLSENDRYEIFEEIRGSAYFIEAKPGFLLSCSTQQTNLMPWSFETKDVSGQKITLSDNEKNRLFLLLMHCSKDANDYGSDLLKHIYFVEAMVTISAGYMKQNSVKYENAAYKEFVQPTIEYIESNMQEILSLEKIALHVGVSKNYLCRIFKAGTGITINQYIQERRIEKATELLLSGKNVTEVSSEVGFNDYTYFIKTFKSIMGTTPAKYVREHRAS